MCSLFYSFFTFQNLCQSLSTCFHDKQFPILMSSTVSSDILCLALDDKDNIMFGGSMSTSGSSTAGIIGYYSNEDPINRLVWMF